MCKYQTKYINKLIEELEELHSKLFYRIYREDSESSIIDGNDVFFEHHMKMSRLMSSIEKSINDKKKIHPEHQHYMDGTIKWRTDK